MNEGLQPPALYGIADLATLGRERIVAAVGEMGQAGVRWIQLRLKAPATDAELYLLASACAREARSAGVRLWIDDRADLALLVGADGVHVGQDDLSPAAARRVLGRSCWIGQSTHDLDQLRRADTDPDVDVIAFGPVFPTASKALTDPVVGLESLRQARGATRKPLVAIGGIAADQLEGVRAAGADSIAVINALCQGDVGANARRLLARLERR